MAELTGEGAAGARASNEEAAQSGTGIVDPPMDPRSVRVRIVDGGRDAPAIRVSPAPEPLRMTNPSFGTGLLGGAALRDLDDDAPPVLAQRQILVDGLPVTAAIRWLGGGRLVLDEEGTATRAVLEAEAASGEGTRVREVLVDGFRFLVAAESERVAALRERATRGRSASAHAGPLLVKAIIPGKVVAVSVKPGDEVEAGQQLLVVEAMKMQNELRSPRDGTIERVGVSVGVNIEIGDLLVVIS